MYSPVPDGSEGTWQLSSPQIYVNGQTSSTLENDRTIIFDSGTPNVYFSPDTTKVRTRLPNPAVSKLNLFPTKAIYAMISPKIKPYKAESGAYGIACSEIDQLPAEIAVTFATSSGEPFNLTIPSSEFNVGPFEDDPSTCQTMINALEGLDLLGGSLLKHYYSVWDVGNQQMGFAPNGELCGAVPLYRS